MTDKTIKLEDQNLPERTTLELKPGERVALCRCWQSKKFPYCDGAHRTLNEDQGCCLGPVIVSTTEES